MTLFVVLICIFISDKAECGWNQKLRNEGLQVLNLLHVILPVQDCLSSLVQHGQKKFSGTDAHATCKCKAANHKSSS